jgi:myosin heavy subunit
MDIFVILSCILHLGNIEFSTVENSDQAVLSHHQHHVREACMLMGMGIEGTITLATAITSRYLKSGTRSSFYTIPLTVPQAKESVDALSKVNLKKKWKTGELV